MSDRAPPGGSPDPASAAPAVILVGTQLGENIGTAARAMLNFGLTDLRLVRPKCGWPNVKALNAASGATEVLNRVRLFERIEDATADLHRLYATTARPRDLQKRTLDAAAAAREGRAEAAAGRQVGLLFGPERTGLANDDLLYADAVVTVSLNPAFASLNLAQAVLLLGYEWFKAGEPAPLAGGPSEPRPATKGELEGLFAQLIEELDAVDFFRAPDRRQSLVRTLKVLGQRAGLREPDIHLLHGVVKALVRGRRGRT
jgi:tRNA/rRNA methyltransferase